MRKKSRGGFGGALAVLLAMLLLLALVPSSGPVGRYSDMIPKPTYIPDGALAETTDIESETPAPTVPSATAPIKPLAAATSAPVATTPAVPSATAPTEPLATAPAEPLESDATSALSGAIPTVQPTAVPTPAPTPAPTPVPPLLALGEVFDRRGDGSALPRLPLDDFSGGVPPLAEGYSEDRSQYSDDSISVTVYQERVNGTLYTVADVQIMDVSQLRAGLGGTTASAARSGIIKLADRLNAVVAINGDFYPNRTGGYIVRQGQTIADGLSNNLDLLVIDYEGNFHGILASEKATALEAFAGDIYQCLCFGPVMIRDGKKLDHPENYAFGAALGNPRAGIGQLGERHYLLVVASGRSDTSRNITVSTLRDFFYDKGCTQAYNLDGGTSAEMYFDGDVCSVLTRDGMRSLYDILYFASTAGLSYEEVQE